MSLDELNAYLTRLANFYRLDISVDAALTCWTFTGLAADLRVLGARLQPLEGELDVRVDVHLGKTWRDDSINVWTRS